MKSINKNLVSALVLMVVTSALYRVIPGRPYGFAPQIAVAIFSGSLFIKNKRIAFLLPLLSMLVSDGFYQFLYLNGWADMPGFYSGQWENYLLFVGLTCFGFLIQLSKIASIFSVSLITPTVYFLVSNTMVWLFGGGYNRPKNVSGFITCLADGIPFYKNSLFATLVFSTILFGSMAILHRITNRRKAVQ